MPFNKVDPKQNFPKMEEDILKFWEKEKIFEKSVERRKGAPIYSFYDGPPFATGLPHHGHLLASTSKDVVPRYWTMKGYVVSRRWGWDTHGLPVENIVEKRLGYKSKKEIEENIEKFNKEARNTVLEFAGEWKKTIRRIGRWVDFDNSYKTMDSNFMESVWWGFKELYKKGLVYKDSRISLYCPRCSTPLSNFEIAMDNSYKEDKDVSVYVKNKVKGEEKMYFLVWTTTPWTLLANVALAVGENITYVKVQIEDEVYIIAKDRLEEIEGETKIIGELKGSQMVGMKYEPIFPHEIKNGYQVVAGEFVNTDEGTGIVHMAPAFGEDDFQSRKKNSLPMIENVDDEGKFLDGDWKGEKVWDANFKIVGYLKDEGLLFKKKNITHAYPHCYRCDTKLIYKAQPAWFIKVSDFKEKLITENEKIEWYPEHLKHGRFLDGLENAPDWNISRSRYWGNPMPIWECKKCGEIKIVGSYEELEKISGIKLNDYHRPFIDKIYFSCEKCQEEMKRIPDVFDCWVESGSMPFAEFHYPFENKEIFEKRYPAQFISEYIAQTRGWFYTLHVLSVGLFEKLSFIHAVTTGTIAGRDGKKMSKSLGNFTDPNVLLDKYGADSFRFYLMQSSLMEGENLNFSDKELEDVFRGTFRMLWNSYSFFVLYANIDKFKTQNSELKTDEGTNSLDRWIISELNLLIKNVDENMENYQLSRAARCFPKFIDNLSNWYIRRSRKRFWKSKDDADKGNAYQTLYTVLVELSKLMAPFTPFIAEEIYRNLMDCHSEPGRACLPAGRESNLKNKLDPSTPSPAGESAQDDNCSVHLADFPKADEKLIDEKLNEEMGKARDIITEALQLRAKAGIKVRQPLSELRIMNHELSDEFLEIIKEEVNVKKVIQDDKFKEIELDTEITPDLKLEGQAREIIRFVQEMRKEAGYEVDNRIQIGYKGAEAVFAKFGKIIAKETLAEILEEKILENYDLKKTFKVDKEEAEVSLKY